MSARITVHVESQQLLHALANVARALAPGQRRERRAARAHEGEFAGVPVCQRGLDVGLAMGYQIPPDDAQTAGSSLAQ